MSKLLKAKCPYDDCPGEVIELPANAIVGQDGVCPIDFRAFRVVKVDKENGVATLSATE